jgi:hypothetical protein
MESEEIEDEDWLTNNSTFLWIRQAYHFEPCNKDGELIVEHNNISCGCIKKFRIVSCTSDEIKFRQIAGPGMTGDDVTLSKPKFKTELLQYCILDQKGPGEHPLVAGTSTETHYYETESLTGPGQVSLSPNDCRSA